ncbi:hypothetical protein ACHAWF_018186 [Thalassiosira exigua]
MPRPFLPLSLLASSVICPSTATSLALNTITASYVVGILRSSLRLRPQNVCNTATRIIPLPAPSHIGRAGVWIMNGSMEECPETQLTTRKGARRSQTTHYSAGSDHISEVKCKEKEANRKMQSADKDKCSIKKGKRDHADGDLNLLIEWISHESEDFHSFTPEEANNIRAALLKWYRKHRRKLPWRGDAPPYDGSTAGINGNGKKKTPAASKKKGGKESVPDYNIHAKQVPQTAYGIWVSEIMLQQTRVEAVIPYWLKWMESFPTVHDLANASEEEVNSHWAGLGFYRRARLLHQAAQHIVSNYRGELPQTVGELKSIPGIGPYTAGAIASIAYDACEPLVDGNVCRVLSRLTGVANHIKAPVFKDKLAWDLAKQLVSAGDGRHAGELNQALMELGATYCAPSGTGIDANDPLKDFYLSTQLGSQYQKYVTRQGSESAVIDVEKALKHQAKPKSQRCKLCDKEGISVVLEQLSNAMDGSIADQIEADDADDMARKSGHSVFPIDPPKQSKREEVLAVAAISSVRPKNGKRKGDKNGCNTYWLLVKRPKSGLLAGQWEFPSVCIWDSNSNKGEKKRDRAPNKIAAKDRRTLISYLGELLVPSDDKMCSKRNIGFLETSALGNMKKLNASPLEHIFSHVRHRMWIDYASVQISDINDDTNSWLASNEREVRWMTESEMEKLGVTAGVKKILKAVKDEQVKKSKAADFFQPRKKSKYFTK